MLSVTPPFPAAIPGGTRSGNHRLHHPAATPDPAEQAPNLSLGAKHPLPASVYPDGAVVSRLLIALMCRVQVCIPVVPVAHACRPRMAEPAGPPACGVVPAGSQLLYKLQGDSGRETFSTLAFPALLGLAN